jgi:tight adherence protein C
MATLKDFIVSTFWMWNALAHGLSFYLIGRLLLYGYREHAYLYQIQNKSKAMDNAIQLIVPYLKKFKWIKYRAFIERNLSRAGTRIDWDSSHFIASQIIYGAISFALSYVFIVMLLDFKFFFVLLLVIFAALLPLIKLMEIAQLRYTACSKDLPFYIDYLTLAMGAGLDFNKGLNVVIADAPNSPLKDEFSLVMRNIQLGMSREDSLVEMQRRMDAPGLSLFVQTLIQAIKMGTDVVHTLTVISETLQTKRFQAAEEQAGKISVKMMIPMMVFVMPATVIILLGPMVLEWLQKSV